VTYNSPKIWQLGWESLRPLLTLFLLVYLVSTLGLGWILKSALFLLGLLVLLPIVGVLGILWWSRRNVVQGACPVCDVALTGLQGTAMDCPNCGEALQINQGQFLRLAPPNTIDIAAVEIDTP
jgi:predicted RNA-binding Zn-ribbon protein involved in translation (DUF1610 family)